LEYTINQLAKKWKCSRRTALRRVEAAGYKTEIRLTDVTQKQRVMFIELED
jgi:hypothetical protein